MLKDNGCNIVTFSRIPLLFLHHVCLIFVFVVSYSKNVEFLVLFDIGPKICMLVCFVQLCYGLI